MTQTVTEKATTYQEAQERFLAWRPTTLKREGANGMTFDYLPVQDYENYLDETVGGDNWESDIQTGEKGVGVALTIFGVRKSSSSSIHIPAKLRRQNNKTGDVTYVENPQPNEVEKAEARAFRRAAGKHGMLRYLWEKEGAHTEDSEPRQAQSQARTQTQSRPAAARSNGNQKTSAPANKASGGNGNFKEASEGQVKWLGNLGVPATIIDQINAYGGKQSDASRLMDALFKRRNPDQDGYDEDPAPHIEEALQEIGLVEFIPLLDAGDVDLD